MLETILDQKLALTMNYLAPKRAKQQAKQRAQQLKDHQQLIFNQRTKEMKMRDQMKTTGSQIDHKNLNGVSNPTSLSSAEKGNVGIIQEVLQETQGENLESEIITESGNNGDGVANFGPGDDNRLAAMEDGQDLTKGMMFGKSIARGSNKENEP